MIKMKREKVNWELTEWSRTEEQKWSSKKFAQHAFTIIASNFVRGQLKISLTHRNFGGLIWFLGSREERFSHQRRIDLIMFMLKKTKLMGETRVSVSMKLAF